MSSIEDLHQQANRLRQENKFSEALRIYEKVWPVTGDKYDGAGLLCCLRKLRKYDKAISLAIELTEKFPDFQWGKNEAIWTLISGRLNRLDDNASLGEVLEIASDIMQLNPEDLASKISVFKVLKAAKAEGKWDIVHEWVEKLNPEKLSTVPMTDDTGKEGWCDQSLWYNYKAKSLIESGKAEEIFQFIDEVIDKYPKQKKFFLRLKALSFHNLGSLNESEECYKVLCSVRRPDWWLLHEYAKVIKDKGDKNEALKLMSQAAISNKKLETMVTLFKEMGLLCGGLGKKEMARAHLALSSLVRSEKGWSIPEIITNSISEINLSLGNNKTPSTIKEALGFCRQEWEGILGINKSTTTSIQRKPRKGVTGKVFFGSTERPFCFIKDNNNNSFFCFKSDLPEGIRDGETVSFTALPSFDKKKNRESWKAVDIAKC